MPPLSLFLFISIFIFSFTIHIVAQIAALPDSNLAQPSLVLPIASTPPATIPAFPEQSDAASTCSLNFSDAIFHGIARSCSPSSSRSHCCPVLAAYLYSAYSATALGGGSSSTILPAAAEGYDLPVLPDDSESCAATAEAALRARGVALPRHPANTTCGAAYCYCSIRLHRLACPGPFLSSATGRSAPRPELARRLERDCSRSGLSGCSRCLTSLNQLKSNMSGSGNLSGKSQRKGGDRECQLMGLTWLLSKNRERYLPAAAAVLRAFMASPGGKAAVCSLSSDVLPVAVGSGEITGENSAAAGQGFGWILLLSVTWLYCFASW